MSVSRCHARCTSLTLGIGLLDDAAISPKVALCKMTTVIGPVVLDMANHVCIEIEFSTRFRVDIRLYKARSNYHSSCISVLFHCFCVFHYFCFIYIYMLCLLVIQLRIHSCVLFMALENLCRRNHVPMELASRIQRFVEHAHSQKQKQMSITDACFDDSTWDAMGLFDAV